MSQNALPLLLFMLVAGDPPRPAAPPQAAAAEAVATDEASAAPTAPDIDAARAPAGAATAATRAVSPAGTARARGAPAGLLLVLWLLLAPAGIAWASLPRTGAAARHDPGPELGLAPPIARRPH